MNTNPLPNAEATRIAEMANSPRTWRLWGPYLAERQWGTVREDYSVDGSAWEYFPHDHARSRAYRWGEDGLAGISDIRQQLCFAVALWNGADPILKERLFGLTNSEGNHGEDVKELYWYADATPSHSYLKFVYRYPQRAFPYEQLIQENARRKSDPHSAEFELEETGAFEENRYFEVTVEYAKADTDDIIVCITAHNAGPEDAPLWILPTFWFRNTWSWSSETPRPEITRVSASVLQAQHETLGSYTLAIENPSVAWLTQNESNNSKLWGTPENALDSKDAFGNKLIYDQENACESRDAGTKACFVEQILVPANASKSTWLRLSRTTEPLLDKEPLQQVMQQRRQEADEFYAALAPPQATPAQKQVQREAFAGLIWSKQYYKLDVERWLDGDPGQPPPPEQRKSARNSAWRTLNAADILSMPDTWEYPWFAAWDLAFHMIPFAQIDPEFAKHQLLLLCREWYMHPSGQLPAYEWAFEDVNPPVHAWAALRVYKIERKRQGKRRDEPGDTVFLEKIFHKLLLNFTWWVNRKDAKDNNLFEGGFLGLDNIGVFDRSAPLPTGGTLEQCDGTAWMAMFSLNMLAIALELCKTDPTYEDVATKFAEHFVYIAHAFNHSGVLWDEADGWFYDALRLPDGATQRLPVRSIVGLIPLFAVEVFDSETLARVPGFRKRLKWFMEHKPGLCAEVAHLAAPGQSERVIFSLVGQERLRRVLTRALDPNEFLSEFGIRSLSAWHRQHPFALTVSGQEYRVAYDPGDSTSGLFGGNSNWRGPIWMPLNYLLIESLQKFDYAYGTSFPWGDTDLWGVATDLSQRLISLIQRDPSHPHYLFHEYFHGDTGAGLGANHQTGWTALVAKLIAQAS
ncbi:glucosidase [Armatimonas sp.]|uniref:MGH1-like glycoside hydrolase domain-containing protein n=1 Tax=Armatimonas sp. TaxID=1872638 RepID=UPI00374C99D8